MERILYECRTSGRRKGKLTFKEFFRLVLLNLACVILSHYPNYGYDYGGVGGFVVIMVAMTKMTVIMTMMLVIIIMMMIMMVLLIFEVTSPSGMPCFGN